MDEEQEIPSIGDIRHYFKNDIKATRDVLENSITNSREKSIALTKLDELEMWANRAIDKMESN